MDSQGGSRGFWDQGIELGLDINVGKLTKIEGLEGSRCSPTAAGGILARPPIRISSSRQTACLIPRTGFPAFTGACSASASKITSKDYLPVKDMIVLRGGWLQPQKELIDQPLSKLFMNNAVNSAKGIGGNIPFSSSFSSWGGTALVRPTDWSYAKAGFFMAFPNATSSLNQGVNFGGTPGSNGLMAMAETGVTPKLGAAELPGKYATGAYYWGQEKDSFNGTPQYGQYGFYFQADQMVYREPSPVEPAPLGKGPSDGKSVASGKSFKEPVSTEKPKLSKQGLSLFNLITFSPKYNNVFPFYFQTGMVYQGLIPTRDDDQIGASLAFGNYSYYQTLANRADNDPYQPNYTIFLEGFYRVAINDWAYFQPFIQYVIRPDGSSAVQNATILGFATGVTF